MQKSLESVSEQLRIPGSKSLGPIGQVGSMSRLHHGRSMVNCGYTLEFACTDDACWLAIAVHTAGLGWSDPH